MVIAGDNINIEVCFVKTVDIDQGMRFAMRDGGRTVCLGTSTENLEA